jgi:molecular chaperone DnaJ
MELGFEEAALGCEKEISVTKAEACEACHGTGAEAGSGRKQCPTCRGRGQVEQVLGGFMRVRQACPTCSGAGQVVEKPCRKCRGSGQVEKPSTIPVRIPAGVDSGTRLRLSGKGESGVRGGQSGDLYLVLHVRAHEIFQRDGDDLLCEVPISFVQAALGAEIQVPTLGGSAQIRIPAGTQNSTVFRLKGRGIKNVQGHATGDLHVRVLVEVPARLNSVQQEKLKEFAAACDQSVNPRSKSFFEKAKRFFI